MDALKKSLSDFFGMNDDPHKMSLGFALGVFLGILPGAGPLAAMFLAKLFRVNATGAFLGGLLTNTWLSIVALPLAAYIGVVITGHEWQAVLERVSALIKDFSWRGLLDLRDIAAALIAGFFVVSLLAGVCAYFLSLVIIRFVRENPTKKAGTTV